MTAPTVLLRVDWENTGAFDNTPMDTVSPLMGPEGGSIHLRRGTSADFSTEAIDELTFTLENDNDWYTPNRQWHDNPSFEVGTTGWDTSAAGTLTVAATSLTKVSDNATGGGTAAGEAVLTATLHSGVSYPIPHTFRSGGTYAYSVWLKSTAGTVAVQCGLASSGTPTDISTAAGTITTSWAKYSGTWTPSADRSDAVFYLRTTAAATATVRIDAIQVNPGGTAYSYLEQPSRGMLTPGKPVHLQATLGGTVYPRFYGHVERLTYDHESRTVEVQAEGVLGRMNETEIAVPALSVSRTARDLRLAVLSDYERGSRNPVANPSFETNTTGWSVAGSSTITRVTTDGAQGTCCGEFVSGTGPILYATNIGLWYQPGEIFTFSVYLRQPSGTNSWQIGWGTADDITVTPTATWARYSVTMTAGTTMVGTPAITALSSPSTLRVDGAMLTRGPFRLPYSDTGTGRWPSMLTNGSFDAGTSPWEDAWKNFVTNGSFETNTSGWSVAGDAFTTAATSITRTVSGAAPYGGAYADVKPDGTSGKGTFYAITGTFLAGVSYSAGCWLRVVFGTSSLIVGVGSQGTPADFAVSVTTTVADWQGWLRFNVTWTPSSNRTDAHLYAKSNDTTADFLLDGAYAYQTGRAIQPYADTGPAGGGFASTSSGTSSTAKYGSLSQSVVTPATANVGRISTMGYLFGSGQPYTFSVWLYVATGTLPYKIGISADAGDGTRDEATATGTVSAATWTQATVTWTPSASRVSVVALVYQTDATARTFLFDGARIIPGSSADDFEMTQWAIPATAESDVLLASATFSGSALAALRTLNGLALSRHWIAAATATPWYAYTVEDRDTFDAKTADETVTDIDGWEGVEIDRASIVNVQKVTWTSGTATASDWYSDAASITSNGPRPGSDIDGTAYYPDRTVPDLVGPAVVARYKQPRMRPKATIVNLFPTQVARDPGDLIVVTIPRHLVVATPFIILSEDLTVSEAGGRWVTTYQLEEYPG